MSARVFRTLGPGEFHSGADLALAMNVSRNAIWKAVGALKELGLPIHAVRNRGYRLAVPVAPLDAAGIRDALPAAVQARVRGVEVAWQLASTNSTLLTRTDGQPGCADVLLAESQTAGRGRRGRTWLASPGGALCFSLGWTFAQLPRDMGSLGLVVGVCALQALADQRPAGAEPVLQLKWPNDLMCEDRKLGGILIDLRAEAGGPGYAVIGIGLNVALPAAAREQIRATGTEPTDLRALGITPLERNAVTASLIQCLIKGLQVFERDGLAPFREAWQRADALMDRPVQVATTGEITRGVARGIDADGALLVDTARGRVRFMAGEVSVRARE